MKITIQSIPHERQRYETSGDYYFDSLTNSWLVKVSWLRSEKEMFLIAIHELIELALCQVKGISNAEIDKFDMEFSSLLGSEPGDCFDAPYYHQHQIATGVERILAAEMGVDWLEYEQHIAELYNET